MCLFILEYTWTDRTAVNYVNWAPHQPDNFLGKEDCGEIFTSSGLWNDQICGFPNNWICKISKGITVLLFYEKQWWSTEWTTSSHLKSLSLKKTMIYDIGNPNPGLRQAHKCGGIKPVNMGSQPLLIIRYIFTFTFYHRNEWQQYHMDSTNAGSMNARS